VLRGAEAKPLALFHLSISYLTLLFVAVAAGQFVR
jgi:heme O synthase-like polyprenyltransferase